MADCGFEDRQRAIHFVVGDRERGASRNTPPSPGSWTMSMQAEIEAA